MAPRPFRFGISFGGSPTRKDLVTSIRRAEAAGFEVVAAADHISRRLAVMPLLSTAAEVSSMRVSPMVIANDYRHPVTVARDAATLDILSEEPFELGIGAGWIKEHYDSAGSPTTTRRPAWTASRSRSPSSRDAGPASRSPSPAITIGW